MMLYVYTHNYMYTLYTICGYMCIYLIKNVNRYSATGKSWGWGIQVAAFSDSEHLISAFQSITDDISSSWVAGV